MPDDRPKLAPSKVLVRGDKYLLVQPETGGWLLADRRVARMVELCDGTRPLEDIAELLGEELGEPAGVIAEDLKALIPMMRQSGFGWPLPEFPSTDASGFPLLGGLINLTNACNLSCSYCYLSAGERMENELTTGEVKDVIDQMAGLKGAFPGQQRVNFSGGEPLLRDDIWEIARYARERGFWTKVTTNGTLVDAETAKKLAGHFDHVAVSLDGSREDHERLRGEGSYDSTIEGIRRLSETGVEMSIGCVGTSENIGSVLELIDVAKEFGIKTIALGMLNMTGRAEGNTGLRPSDEEYVELMRSYKRRVDSEGLDIKLVGEKFMSIGQPVFRPHGCLAGIGTISIDSDGSVYPCTNAILEEFRMGNVRDSSLEDIRANSPVAKEWAEATLETIPECKGCVWKRYCGGACRVNAYSEHGTVNAPDMYCGVYSALLEDAFFELRRR